jgi:hypothetical protein
MDFQLTCGANNSHKYIYLSSSTGIYFQMGGYWIVQARLDTRQVMQASGKDGGAYCFSHYQCNAVIAQKYHHGFQAVFSEAVYPPPPATTICITGNFPR